MPDLVALSSFQCGSILLTDTTANDIPLLDIPFVSRYLRIACAGVGATGPSCVVTADVAVWVAEVSELCFSADADEVEDDEAFFLVELVEPFFAWVLVLTDKVVFLCLSSRSI